MNPSEARVIERRTLAPELVLLWFSAPAISALARPGQFVMVRTAPGLDPFLPRALWIHRLRDGDSDEEMALLVREVGPGTRLLADALPGQRFQLNGPLGRPLRLAPGVRHLLLIGEGFGIAPLIWLADEELARGRSVALLLAGSGGSPPYPLTLIRPEVEVVTAEAEDPDQSFEHHLLRLATWADQLVVCAGAWATDRLNQALQPLPFRRPCIVLLAPPMVCGTGICGGCAVPIRRRGMRLACVDGPAFALRDLA